jgi:hypothetical protein
VSLGHHRFLTNSPGPLRYPRYGSPQAHPTCDSQGPFALLGLTVACTAGTLHRRCRGARRGSSPRKAVQANGPPGVLNDICAPERIRLLCTMSVSLFQYVSKSLVRELKLICPILHARNLHLCENSECCRALRLQPEKAPSPLVAADGTCSCASHRLVDISRMTTLGEMEWETLSVESNRQDYQHLTDRSLASV